MKNKKLISFLTLILLVSLLLSACTPSESTGEEAVVEPTEETVEQVAEEAVAEATEEAVTEATEQIVEEVKEKVLTIGTPYGIGSLTPWISNSDGDTYVLSNVYETLICDDTSSFKPGLAESWSNEDDVTYVFTLRQNAYWQTGNDLFGDEKVQVTASDIKAVFDFVMDEANASTSYADMVKYVKSVEAVDDFSLKVITNYPTALVIKTLSGVKIFPIKAIEQGFDLVAQPVGSGPYHFAEYLTDDQITLVRNEDYFIRPNLDKVIFKIIPDKAVAAIALQNQEIDIAPQILATDLEAVADKEFLVLLPNTVGWYRYLAFNCSLPMFQDIRVRQAISMAIDFESIVEALFSNDFGAKLAYVSYGGGVPFEFEGTDVEAWKAVYEFNPEKAEQLLQEAGWVRGADGIYEKDGQKLKFTIKSPASDQNRIKFGDMAATYLKNIGIDAASQPTEWATLTSDINTGNTEMFIMGGGSVLGGMNMLFHSAVMPTSAHNVLYTDPELDAMLDQAYATVNDTERVALLKECSMRALENKVHAGGYFEYIQIGMNTRVKDFDKSPTLWYGLTTPFRNVDIE